jgi:phage-related protein
MPALHDFPKPLLWVGSSKKDLQAMPDEVQDSFGYALHLAQTGAKHAHAKPLKGFGSAGVLHCFQKKSTSGIATPKPDLDLIRDRLKAALAHAGQVAP